MKLLLVPQGAVIVRFSDSPLYGMLDIRTRLNQQIPAMVQQLISAQRDTDAVSIKWDGEWQITYETFRDMGLAYGVGLTMIYLLVVYYA